MRIRKKCIFYIFTLVEDTFPSLNAMKFLLEEEKGIVTQTKDTLQRKWCVKGKRKQHLLNCTTNLKRPQFWSVPKNTFEEEKKFKEILTTWTVGHLCVSNVLNIIYYHIKNHRKGNSLEIAQWSLVSRGFSTV